MLHGLIDEIDEKCRESGVAVPKLMALLKKKLETQVASVRRTRIPPNRSDREFRLNFLAAGGGLQT